MGKPYWFVKRTESGISAKMFVRFSEGNGSIYPIDEAEMYSYEPGPPWEELWDSLVDEGFVAERDAKRQGLVPADWVPPEGPWFPTS